MCRFNLKGIFNLTFNDSTPIFRVLHGTTYTVIVIARVRQPITLTPPRISKDLKQIT